MGASGKEGKSVDVPLPCGCVYVATSTFVGGGRQHECSHRRVWVISAQPIREVRYHVAEKVAPKMEEE